MKPLERRKPMSLKEIRSAVVIARMLGTEGFSPAIANTVRRWWRRRCANRKRLQNYARAQRALSEMVKRNELSEGDRLILGRFVACHAALNFEAGIRIGLTASMYPVSEAPGKAEADG